jgi:hypothetical protein
LEENSIHPWEGVGNIIDSRLFQFVKEAIGIELNVLAHEGCIHTHEVEPKHLANEAFFDMESTVNNLPDADRARKFELDIVEDTGKVTVKGFIMVDERICKI